MYKKLLNFPKLILLSLIIILLGSLYFSKNFKLDASADTLLLENDPDLKYLREVNERYGSEEFFILTYEPKAVINKDSVLELEKFVTKINNLNWVSKTISVINAPLLQSTNEPLMERIQNLKYITSPNIEFETAIKELTSSPIYKNLIISKDSKTFGIVVYLKENKQYLDLISKKSRLLENNNPDESLLADLKKTNAKLDIEKKKQGDLISSYNQEIKNLIAKQNQFATIRLSGIPMIADDMITFIKNDIVIFGFGVFAFIIFILWMVFRNLKWVAFPLINCFSSILIMVGFLGALQWKVTVISSNFIALMLILTISMNIHYLVRYIQIKNENENATPIDLVTKTSSSIFYPIFYAVLTTICAFMSLVFSDIKPVMDFGWMMTYGLLVSFALSFLLLPSLILVFNPKASVQIKEKKSKFAELLAHISTQFPKLIYSLSVFLIIFSIYGISKLKVENSFINYFSSKTEIYKGMKNIDEKLGGTTPLEIILKFKKTTVVNKEDDFLGSTVKKDDYLGEDKQQAFDEKYKYWFTRDKIDKIISVHKYLEQNQNIGKVLSFSSILDIAESLNNGKKLGSLEMGVLYNKLPEDIKRNIINPYISVQNDEARISMRILDSKPDLRRKELIEKIQSDLQTKFLFKQDEFKITGVLIIFNNLLQSLFDSQIKTLGIVMLGIFLMFLILFRSLTYSLIGTVPNFIAAFFVLGFIGALNIPLDMMTITIAAITIGIAVDNSIHYIYRFRQEIKERKNKNDAVYICHHTVGKAIISTSVTIVFGFSILGFSNFIPTIYFGLFTGLAMITALILVLTLLPRLLIQFAPETNG
ncbi:membrane protein [Candidatus Pelagibacter sp. IMCC9063]|uniref:efflux RND transporter permease subunit n=1 Tax=Pelagibacter sp. (strain IMCC9063) TaxID=1002672 RepID=UPI00020466C4|nr:MMPL family transporter [Candidatus Pelagibacter sp. IMCC9063]AEA81400.1 membrane protein [Candidatus Pelagibacter sp. IMCC9063]